MSNGQVLHLNRRTAYEALARSVETAASGSTVVHEPCTHTYFEHVFSDEVYAQIIQSLPPRGSFHELRHRDAMLPDGSSTRLRLYLFPENLWRVPRPQRALWREVARALMSDAVQDGFKNKFRDALERRFGRSVDRLHFYPVPILVRDQPGYRIGIHADASSKAITVQFYLPRDASQRHLGTLFHRGRNSEAAADTTAMDFMPNTGYAFPVVPSASWHSVAATGAQDGERCSLMLTYYVQDGPRQWWKRRYDRARCLFGVGPRG
jgi:hypothetical protein